MGTQASHDEDDAPGVGGSGPSGPNTGEAAERSGPGGDRSSDRGDSSKMGEEETRSQYEARQAPAREALDRAIADSKAPDYSVPGERELPGGGLEKWGVTTNITPAEEQAEDWAEKYLREEIGKVPRVQEEGGVKFNLTPEQEKYEDIAQGILSRDLSTRYGALGQYGKELTLKNDQVNLANLLYTGQITKEQAISSGMSPLLADYIASQPGPGFGTGKSGQPSSRGIYGIDISFGEKLAAAAASETATDRDRGLLNIYLAYDRAGLNPLTNMYDLGLIPGRPVGPPQEFSTPDSKAAAYQRAAYNLNQMGLTNTPEGAKAFIDANLKAGEYAVPVPENLIPDALAREFGMTVKTAGYDAQTMAQALADLSKRGVEFSPAGLARYDEVYSALREQGPLGALSAGDAKVGELKWFFGDDAVKQLGAVDRLNKANAVQLGPDNTMSLDVKKAAAANIPYATIAAAGFTGIDKVEYAKLLGASAAGGAGFANLGGGPKNPMVGTTPGVTVGGAGMVVGGKKETEKPTWWSKITPWKEEKGETFGTAVAGVGQKISKWYESPLMEYGGASLHPEATRYVQNQSTGVVTAYSAAGDALKTFPSWEEADKWAGKTSGKETLWSKARDIVFGKPSVSTTPWIYQSPKEILGSPEFSLVSLGVAGAGAPVLAVRPIPGFAQTATGFGKYMEFGIPQALRGGAWYQRAGLGAIQAMKIPFATTVLATPPTIAAGMLTKPPEQSWEQARQEIYQNYLKSPDYQKQVADLTSREAYQNYLKSQDYLSQVRAIEAQGNTAIPPTYDEFKASVKPPTAEEFYRAAKLESPPMEYATGLAGIIGRGTAKISTPVVEKLQSVSVAGGLLAGGFQVLNPYPVMASLYPEKGALSAATMFPYYGPITGTTALTWKELSPLQKALCIGFTVLPAAQPVAWGGVRALAGREAFPETSTGIIAKATREVNLARGQLDTLIRGGAPEEFIADARANLSMARGNLKQASPLLGALEDIRGAQTEVDALKASGAGRASVGGAQLNLNQARSNFMELTNSRTFPLTDADIKAISKITDIKAGELKSVIKPYTSARQAFDDAIKAVEDARAKYVESSKAGAGGWASGDYIKAVYEADLRLSELQQAQAEMRNMLNRMQGLGAAPIVGEVTPVRVSPSGEVYPVEGVSVRYGARGVDLLTGRSSPTPEGVTETPETIATQGGGGRTGVLFRAVEYPTTAEPPTVIPETRALNIAEKLAATPETLGKRPLYLPGEIRGESGLGGYLEKVPSGYGIKPKVPTQAEEWNPFKYVEPRVLAPTKPAVGVGTSTAPTTATMTAEAVARQRAAMGVQEEPATYLTWERTQDGMLVPRWSTRPKIATAETALAPEAAPAEVPVEVPSPVPATMPVVLTGLEALAATNPALNPYNIPKFELSNLLGLTTKPSSATEVETAPIVEITPQTRIPTPTPTPIIPVEETPPPVRKIPPPVPVPLKFPSLPGLAGGGGGQRGMPAQYTAVKQEVPEMVVYLPNIQLMPPKAAEFLAGRTVEKHGTHSTYVERPEKVPVNEYTLEEMRAMKPAGISAAQWEKLIHSSQGVELLGTAEPEMRMDGEPQWGAEAAKAKGKSIGQTEFPKQGKGLAKGLAKQAEAEAPVEEELTMTPFGFRKVYTVTERAVLKGGARQNAIGSINIETGRAAKQRVGRGMSARQARKLYGYGRYEFYHTLSQPEIKALAKASRVEK